MVKSLRPTLVRDVTWVVETSSGKHKLQRCEFTARTLRPVRDAWRARARDFSGERCSMPNGVTVAIRRRCACTAHCRHCVLKLTGP